MYRFTQLLKKILENKTSILNFISFILGTYFSIKNKSDFGVEFNKIYNKLIILQKFIDDLIYKFK